MYILKLIKIKINKYLLFIYIYNYSTLIEKLYIETKKIQFIINKQIILILVLHKNVLFTIIICLISLKY